MPASMPSPSTILRGANHGGGCILAAFAGACSTVPEWPDVGRFLVPDEVSASRGFGEYGSDAWAGQAIDEDAVVISATWYTMPREVRVLDPVEAPRSWIEPDRPEEGATLALGGGVGLKVPTDPDTGEIPLPRILAILGGLLVAAATGWGIWKARIRAAASESPQDQREDPGA